MGSVNNDQNELLQNSLDQNSSTWQDDQRRIAQAERAAAIAQSKAHMAQANHIPQAPQMPQTPQALQTTMTAVGDDLVAVDGMLLKPIGESTADLLADKPAVTAATTNRTAPTKPAQAAHPASLQGFAAKDQTDKNLRRAKRRTGVIVALLLALMLTAALAAAWWFDLLPSFGLLDPRNTVSDSEVTHSTAPYSSSVDDAVTENTEDGTGYNSSVSDNAASDDAGDDEGPVINAAAPDETTGYPVVHIEGLPLPEEYGDGLLSPDAVFALVNIYREQNGLPELERVNQITMNATITRLDEARYNFSHTRPNGEKFSTVFKDYEIPYDHVVENLAEGQFTAEHVMKDWIESPSHNANLLDDQITAAAVACGANEAGKPVWIFIGIKYPEE